MICTPLIKPLQPLVRHARTSRVWLFDLDNTLHDASYAIFDHIHQSMTRAVMQTLDVDHDEATVLRKKYWARYGATLIGMVKHHGVSARDFLHLSHDFDIAGSTRVEKNLSAMLNAVPGIKYVVTNAPMHYARIVLDRLNVRHCFAGICSINEMCLQGRYRPKPSPALMRQLLVQLQCDPAHTILVEDTLKNLKTAKQLNMKTVHIFHRGTPFSSMHRMRPAYVDLRVNSVQRLLTHPFALTA